MFRHKAAVLAGVILAASTPPSALAQKTTKQARYTRTQDVKVDVKLSTRVIPRETRPADPKAQRPTLGATDALAIEGLIDTIRTEQEAQLHQMIGETPDSEAEDKANLYFLLGELYAKQQRYWRLRSVELALANDTAKSPKLRQESDAAAAKAKDYLARTVKTYMALTSNDLFRNYPKMDRALFYLGYTLQSGRYYDEARKVYDKLLKDYPRSKFVPEAHIAFGDYFWEQNQLTDAEARYRMVLKFPSSSAYWYAMYKTGWIDLNLQRPQRALETFYQVVQATRTDRAQELLHRASKKDYVRAYAEIGKPSTAYPAFQRVDTRGAFDMLGVLADLYLDQGKSDRAIFVYQEMMKLQPRHKDVCLWQYNIARAMMSLGGATTSDKVKEIENLVRVHSALRGKLPAADAQDCHDNAAAMSGELARAYHSEAERTRNPETLGHAERLYRAYLAGFPDAADFTETQYFHAELLWARARDERDPRRQTDAWETAADAFTRVVVAGKLGPAKLKTSAFAAVLAWKNALDIDPRVDRQAGKLDDLTEDHDSVPPPMPIPAREERMIAAFDLYIAYIKDPKDDDLVGMKFLKANIYRRYHHYPQAIPLFLDILDHHRWHETAEYAAQLLLDTYNRTQREGDLLALVDRLDADKRFLEDKPTLVGVLEKVKVQALRKRAERIEREARAEHSNPKLVACGQAYMDIYNRNPEAAGNDEVLWNALVCYHDGKSVGAALVAYASLKKWYPNSKLYARATGRIGKAYGDIAFYDLAADRLAEYGKKYAGEADAFSALGESVFYSKGIGDDAKAIENTRYFVKAFRARKPAEAANALYSLTAVYEKQGDLDRAVATLREYLRDHAQHGTADRRVIALAKIGLYRWQQSCPIKPTEGSCIKVVRERAITTRGRARGGQRTQCGPEWKSKLTVVPRDERKVKEALAAVADAIKEYERAGGKPGADELGARHYYAQARFVDADHDFEGYLALAFPVNLDFDARNPAINQRSTQRFERWLADRKKLGGQARAKYDATLAATDNATSIAAAARIAQIAQSQSDALFSAEIPKAVRTGPYAQDGIDAFCGVMEEKADPLAVAALEGYRVCLDQSLRLGWFSEWSRLCERELGELEPGTYPTARELRGQPEEVAPIVAVEGFIATLE